MFKFALFMLLSGVVIVAILFITSLLAIGATHETK